MIPNFAIVRIETPRWRMPQLWLPLFLLWILLLLLSPVILLVVLGLSIARRVPPWRIVAVFGAILCSLSGTNVRVCSDGSKVQVRIL
jgi:hypothetical protein